MFNNMTVDNLYCDKYLKLSWPSNFVPLTAN